jgi:hypothetical protein
MLVFMAYALCFVVSKQRHEARVEGRFFKSDVCPGRLIQVSRRRTRSSRIACPQVRGQLMKAGAQHLVVFPEASE